MIASRNNRAEGFMPGIFCWTRFGIEAGETAQSIFERKETERARNGGVFLWGIGHSIRPSLANLLRSTAYPEIIFSPMRSMPSARDASPVGVTLWCDATDFCDNPFSLPEYSLVTSRRDDLNPRRPHYALVCRSETPINNFEFNRGQIATGNLRNLISGSMVGSSQVTSVVQQVAETHLVGTEYSITARARLVYPYQVRLANGIAIPRDLRLDRVGDTTPERIIDALLRLRKAESKHAQIACEPIFGAPVVV
jgi:hypothetical protein